VSSVMIGAYSFLTRSGPPIVAAQPSARVLPHKEPDLGPSAGSVSDYAQARIILHLVPCPSQ
jgi:hypothetical protein